MKKSDKFFYGCLAFIGGVALGEWVALPPAMMLLAFFVLLNVIIWSRRVRLAAVIVLLILSGWFWRGLFVPPSGPEAIVSLAGEKVELIGTVAAEPDVRLDKQKLIIEPKNWRGRLQITAPLYPEYSYGDSLKIVGRLKLPEPVENFRYDRYLEKSGVYAIINQPETEILNRGRANFFIEAILNLKKQVAAAINRTSPEPVASLTAGILLGSRQGLPPALLDSFNKVGITHIIAVSGFNITIIVAVLFNIFRSARVNRKKAFWLIAFFLIIFGILTGLSASVIRASIMGFLVVAGRQLGRLSSIRNVLMMSAAVMILVNPLILVWDAGFQLSFLSTAGLVYLSPLFEKKLSWLPEKFGVRENLTATLAATGATLPLILFQFGRLSLVAPLVNIFILPIIPWAMLFGFAQAVGGLIFLPLGQFFGWFTWLSLTYVVTIANWAGSWRFAAVDFSWPWWALMISYIMIISWVCWVRRKHEA